MNGESEEPRVVFEETVHSVLKSYLFQQGAITPGIDSVVLALHKATEQA